MASISGDLELMPLGDVVLWLANRKASAQLVVKRPGCETRFAIRHGTVLQAASSDPREFLGQHLINFGYIDEDALQRAFETQRETHVPLGRVLVMVEAISTEQLQRVLTFKIREGLLEVLSWPVGTFRVDDAVTTPIELDIDRPVDLLDVYSEGQARAHMWTEIRRVFPSSSTRVEVAVDPALLGPGFDQRLLQLVAQGRSIGEAALELRALDFQTYARMYDLHTRGLIRPLLTTTTVPASELPRAATPMPGSFAPRLGVPVGAVAARGVSTNGTFTLAPPRTATTPPASMPGSLPPGASTEGPPASRLRPPPPPPDDDALEVPDLPSLSLPTMSDAFLLVRAQKPADAPGVVVPAEASDPVTALQLALAGRNWNDAILLASRLLEDDPLHTEALAAYRMAEMQLKRSSVDEAGSVDLSRTPQLAQAREGIALAHLTSKERYVLSRVDGRRTLAQIAAVSPIQRDELVRIVEAFVVRGVLRL